MKRPLVNSSVFLAFAALALVMSYPMIRDMTHFVFNHDRTFDSLIFLWNFWWVKKAIVELGQQPFYTDYIFYPEGTSLVFHSFPFIYNLLSVPVQLFFEDERGPILAFNLITVLSHALTGLGTFLLVDYLTGNKKAAVVSALLFTFCPYRFWNISRLHLLCTEFLVFYVLFFFKMVREDRRRNAICTGVVLALTLYSSLTYFTYVFILSCVFLLYLSLRRKSGVVSRAFLVRGSLALGVFVALSSPLLYYLIRDFLTNPSLYQPLDQTTFWSIDLARVLVPDGSHPLYQKLLRLEGPFHHELEGMSFAGFVLLFLASYALLRCERSRTVLWGISAILFLVFSFGPFLHFAGQTYTDIPLPYLALYRWVPIFKISRFPCRFIVLFVLCLCVLAGFGADRLMKKGSGKAWSSLTFAALALLALAENWVAPVIYDRYTVPEFYREVAAEQDDYVVADVPSSLHTRLLGMYFQIIHGKRTLVAVVPRTSHTSSVVRSSPLLRFFHSRPDGGGLYSADYSESQRHEAIREDRETIVRGKIKYIVLHTQHHSAATVSIIKQILDAYGPESVLVDEEHQVTVYRFF